MPGINSIKSSEDTNKDHASNNPKRQQTRRAFLKRSLKHSTTVEQAEDFSVADEFRASEKPLCQQLQKPGAVFNTSFSLYNSNCATLVAEDGVMSERTVGKSVMLAIVGSNENFSCTTATRDYTFDSPHTKGSLGEEYNKRSTMSTVDNGGSDELQLTPNRQLRSGAGCEETDCATERPCKPRVNNWVS